MVRRSAAIGIALVALLLSACGQGSQGDPGAKVGVVDPVVLTFGMGDFGDAAVPAVKVFMDAITTRSEGRLTVNRTYYATDEVDTGEPVLVGDVANGTMDLGMVGTRSMAASGAVAFNALTAPMLIDDYALQSAVLTSDVTVDLLATTSPVGVVGLAVLGDHLRRPWGGKKALVGLEDFKDASVWTFPTAPLEKASVKALGAKASSMPFIAVNANLIVGELSGMMLDANTLIDNQMDAGYVTVNEAFWPRTMVLLANPAALAGLDAADRDAVRAAAADAAAYSLTIGPASDSTQLARLCANGTHAMVATDDQLSALRTALKPVYADLRKDATSAALLDRIEEIKAGVTPEPVAVPAECSSPPSASPSASPAAVPPRPAAEATAIDGTYRQLITATDLIKAGFTESAMQNGKPCMDEDGAALDCLVENAGTLTYVFDKGTYTWKQRQAGVKLADHGSGYYVVDGDVLTIVDDLQTPEGLPFVVRFRWSKDGDTVTVEPLDETNVAAISAASPWAKVS